MDDIFPRLYSVKRFLLRFFDDPVAFLKFLRASNTLLCGSTVLAYFVRASCNSPLDIFVERRRYRTLKSIIVGAGYHLDATNSGKEFEYGDDTVTVDTYRHLTKSWRALTISTTPRSPLQTLLQSYSSMSVCRMVPSMLTVCPCSVAHELYRVRHGRVSVPHGNYHAG